jgi:hypothetical protein
MSLCCVVDDGRLVLRNVRVSEMGEALNRKPKIVCRWEEDAQVGGAVLSAMQVALGLLHSDGLVVPVPMSAGDMLLIDANRVLWGQTPFGAAGGGSYEAGFVSMDDAISRARVLRRHMPEN